MAAVVTPHLPGLEPEDENVMRGLTLTQPWASFVIFGDKRIENRPMLPPKKLVGKRFAIHAGLRFEDQGMSRDGWSIVGGLPAGHIYPAGQVIGVARIERVIASEKEAAAIGHATWWTGPYAYVLDERIPIQAIDCRGMQGWWPLPANVNAHVRAELARLAS